MIFYLWGANMKDLYIIFRQCDYSEFEKRYNQRVVMESAVKFNLSIKPINQPNVYELYYIPTNGIINKVAEIYRLSGELNFIFDKLPPVAKKQFIVECLVEELYNNNELEGVRSTRDEIARSIKNLKLNKKEKTRFNSMIKSYMSLINGDDFTLKRAIDVRKIYDEITAGEIENSELPDGKIFRKDVTHIFKKSASGKIIHRGIMPEDKIITEVEKMLNVLNELDEVPLLIRIAIGHYFFGYIHPFYDGNGRTSRFISSIYLSTTLGKIPALSLSRGCNKMKHGYLKAFEVANSIMNRGEMNNFIDTFLDIILLTLKEMFAELKEKIQLIETALDKLANDPKIEEKKQLDFMFILAQNHFFHYNDGLTVRELAHELGLSDITVRKIAKELLEKSLIKQEGLRPAHFFIDSTYFES